MGEELLDERGLSKLRWRCRRGLLENDLLIERFFDRHAAGLSVRQARSLGELMDLADNDLLDLLLRRREPEGALDTPDVREVLEMLRMPVGASPGQSKPVQEHL
jgi:antitoxin CptB